MTNQDPSEAMFTIGEFGRLTRLTAKALRIYDDTGLLRPAEVDPRSGYRRYRADQVQTARLIGLLRAADVSLAEITRVLSDLDSSADVASDRLEGYLRDTEAHHSSRRVLILHIQALMRHKEPPMFEVQTRHVPAQRVMSMQRRLHADETDVFVSEAKAAFAAHLAGSKPTGPFTLIFHGTVDNESDGPIEAILGCSESVAPTDVIGIRTEPAHDEAFTRTTKAQWSYPAIIAAYDAVACSPEAQERTGSRLSCREVYIAEPKEAGADDLLCDMAFPLA
ncbi:MAG: MerR family transcriptional regulator [Ilumatobacteraceae bacterium]